MNDGPTHYARGVIKDRFAIWGVSYDHDASRRLLDEYWIDEWSAAVEDFSEMKALGASCVRGSLAVLEIYGQTRNA